MTTPKKSKRGFGGMDPAKQRALASMGGKSIAKEKRSFSLNPDLAREAGAKGGRSSQKKRKGG